MDNSLRQYRSSILELAQKRGVTCIRVFGSRARGDATEFSDYDFLVDLKPEATLFDLGGLSTDLEDLLHAKVDLVTVDSLHWFIREKVLKEAELL